MVSISDKRRALPSMTVLLEHDALLPLVERYGYQVVRDGLRETLDAIRATLAQGNDEQAGISPQALIERTEKHLANAYAPTLQTVINATGIIIHTNLGRAPLSKSAQNAIEAVAGHYSTLEFNIETGKRGSRYIHAEKLLCTLTGAEGALVVNNNASALVLLLSALAKGREVIISRGQSVEIGGGFRIPEIMAQGGARLVEVGTTNRTRTSDYAHAITADTAMLLRVHSSNFRQIGFVEQATLSDMAQVAHERDCLLVDDIGSGALLDTAPFGLLPEPTVQASLEAGADLVCFSGDKLLGATQAGILVGRADIIERLKAHPFARAMRADKLCYAGLNATLEHYLRDEALTEIPIWRMISMAHEAISERARAWQDELEEAGIPVRVAADESAVGGGSLPGATLPTSVMVLDVPAPDSFLADLRACSTPIIARISQGRVLFDPRTVAPEEDGVLLAGVKKVLSQ